jgi:hypothetical protein
MVGLAPAAPARVALVVNRANPVTDLAAQLRRLHLGVSATFPDRAPITLV